MTRVLVTGGGGFVGQWVVRAAIERGDDVVAAGLGLAGDDSRSILTREERASAEWYRADLRIAADVDAMVHVARPDVVIHLAGVAFPPDADTDPAAAYDINTLGVVRLLASLAARRRAGSLDPVTVVIGSALQYGLHAAAEMPLSESAEQCPATVYAATKAAQEVAALQAARASGLRVVCTRSFNHAGVGQPAEYLLPSLVGRVLRMRRDANVDTLKIGNDAVRDYLHVRDVADAYLALAERGRPGSAYNVCSGVGVRVSDLAADILRRAGVAGVAQADPSLSRPTDVPVLIGSPDALMRDTGWTPRQTTGDIIDDLLGFAHAATD